MRNEKIVGIRSCMKFVLVYLRRCSSRVFRVDQDIDKARIHNQKKQLEYGNTRSPILPLVFSLIADRS